jgi:hypothetical protein
LIAAGVEPNHFQNLTGHRHNAACGCNTVLNFSTIQNRGSNGKHFFIAVERANLRYLRHCRIDFVFDAPDSQRSDENPRVTRAHGGSRGSQSMSPCKQTRLRPCEIDPRAWLRLPVPTLLLGTLTLAIGVTMLGD